MHSMQDDVCKVPESPGGQKLDYRELEPAEEAFVARLMVMVLEMHSRRHMSEGCFDKVSNYRRWSDAAGLGMEDMTYIADPIGVYRNGREMEVLTVRGTAYDAYTELGYIDTPSHMLFLANCGQGGGGPAILSLKPLD